MNGVTALLFVLLDTESNNRGCLVDGLTALLFVLLDTVSNNRGSLVNGVTALLFLASLVPIHLFAAIINRTEEKRSVWKYISHLVVLFVVINKYSCYAT